ncbi:uncharacterized protein [Ambystoma mexicanum]|uniref:uncharacterized protein n=1 Tax=Ambystoma mexicanum TaxID=8296 RepID=UPI0037E8BC19
MMESWSPQEEVPKKPRAGAKTKSAGRITMIIAPATWIMILMIVGGLKATGAQVMIEPGPASDIAVEEAPGFIMGNRRLIYQNMYIPMNTDNLIERFINTTGIVTDQTRDWLELRKEDAKQTIRDMVMQLEKTFVNSMDIKKRRWKRGMVLLVVSLVMSIIGAVIGTTMSTANVISVGTLSAKVQQLTYDLDMIQKALDGIRGGLDDQGKFVNETVISLNEQAEILQHSKKVMIKHDQILSDIMNIINPLDRLLTNYMMEVQTAISQLIQGHIPLYFVSQDIVHQMMERITKGEMEVMQVKTAFEMGSAMPLYVNLERMEIRFLLCIPYIAPELIYQTKWVHNVGFWQEGKYIKIKTPEVVAFQSWEPEVYLIPNLGTCMRIKEHNNMCPGKPCVPDATDAICGLKSDPGVSGGCEVVISNLGGDELSQTKLVKNRWLVSTSVKNYTVTHLIHGTFVVKQLKYNVFYLQVPKDTIVSVGV